MLVDLRSDTVTRPTEPMLSAMTAATTEDLSRDGDPTVAALEKRAAALTGKAAAMFVPSGTMGNLAAVLCHTRPGDEVVLEAFAHILRSELGGLSAIAGTLPRPIPGPDGVPDPGRVEELIRTTPAGRLSLLCLECSHNGHGGVVPPMERIASVARLARAAGIAVHLDGARLFNAAVRLACEPAEICHWADSVMVCVSKGLGAPFGSLLCGEEAFVAAARTVVRRLGGGLRQAGPLAAAGLVAFDDWRARLARDHAIAVRLAEGIARGDARLVDPACVQTNIVNVDLGPWRPRADAFVRDLQQRGVLVHRRPDGGIRLVSHRHIGETEADAALAAILAAWTTLLERDPNGDTRHAH